jgi:hypothetical protein
MSNNPSDNALIEQYLLGRMTEEEVHDFLVRVENDRELARKLRLLKTFPEMMSEPARREYEKQQAEAAAPLVMKRSHHSHGSRYIFWTVIIAIVAASIAIFIILNKTGPGKQAATGEDKVVQQPVDVKSPAVPVKDTQMRTIPLQPEEKNETREMNGGTGQKAIELLTPADGMTFSREDSIQFRWAQRTDTFTRFYIFSETNDQVVFWRGIRPGVREYKVPGSSIYTGKYYWFVGTREQKRSFVISE